MEIIRSVLPVILLLLVGMLIRKKEIISPEGISGLQALAMNVCLPAGLFGSFYRTSISADQLILPITFFALVVIAIFVSKPLGRLFGISDRYLPFMSAGYEFGMLGYALIAILVGKENITTFAITDAGHGVAIFTVYLAMLKAVGGEKQTSAQVLKGLLDTPVLVSIIGGILVSVSGLGGLICKTPLGGIIDSVCDFASAPTSAVILVVIGYRMNFKGLDIKRVAKTCSVRLVIQFVFAVLVLLLFKAIGGTYADRLTTITVLLAITLPPPFILPLYVEKEEEKEFYSLAISAYTLLSIIAFIILVIVFS